jgi:threonine/homoserine/homoserine lactone efflux protein
MFILAGLLLAMSPGPDTAYILSRSARHGWRGGALAALGVALGIWVHILAAAAGLSALVFASANAYTAAKLLGAAYLLYLGIGMILSRKRLNREVPSQGTVSGGSTKEIFWQGFLTNVLNPKVALFFLAFLPQFIDSGAESKAAAFVFLGLLIDVIGTLWNLLVARTASQLALWAAESTQILAWIDRAMGAVFIYVGLRLATAEQR